MQTPPVSTLFLIETAPELLDVLKTDKTPKWGVMTAQHMVEHLGFTVKISNGKKNVPLTTPIEQLEIRRTFLFGKLHFPKNVKIAGINTEFSALRFKDLEAAKQALYDEIQDFLTYFEGNDGLKPMHPVFGELTKAEWILFHEKHFKHHFFQFGLLKDY
jgi:hypothetical protein